MNTAYPASLKIYPNGHVGISFADVPEAITAGATAAEALDNATDALVVALSGYLDDVRPLPNASRAKQGQPVVCLPPRVAIKMAIHAALCEAGMTQAELGARLSVDEKQVRRILDLDYESKLSQLEAALAALGLRASVSVEKVSTVVA